MNDNKEIKQDLKEMIKTEVFSSSATKAALERITLLENDVKAINQFAEQQRIHKLEALGNLADCQMKLSKELFQEEGVIHPENEEDVLNDSLINPRGSN